MSKDASQFLDLDHWMDSDTIHHGWRTYGETRLDERKRIPFEGRKDGDPEGTGLERHQHTRSSASSVSLELTHCRCWGAWLPACISPALQQGPVGTLK